MPRVLSPEEVAQLGLDTPAPAAETGGSRVLSPQEAEALGLNDDAKLQAEFGTPGQQVLTGLEGAGQGLTLGGSTWVEKALGVDPERIANREKANPDAHTTGEVIGIAAPILASLGTAAPAELGAQGVMRGAAELSAPSLVSKLGGAVAKGITKALPEATSALGKAGVKTAAGLGQGLTEGAVFGAGHVVHESALGDPNLTAQSAIEEIGMSALIGGGLGGAGGVLSGLAKGASGSKLGEKLGSWLEEFEGNRNLKAAGAIQSDISSAAKRMSREELNKIGREAGDLGLVGPFSTPAGTLEKAGALMDSAGKKMGDILESADGLPGVAPRTMEEIAGRVRKEVLTKLEANPLEKATASQLKEVLNGYESIHATDRGFQLGFEDLHGIRKQISEKLYGLRGTADPQATALKDALHDFRTIVSDELNKGLEGSQVGSAEWKAANREYQVAATVEKLAQKGVDRAVGNNPLGLLSVIMGATGIASHGIPGGAAMAAGAELLKRYGSGVAGAGAKALRESEAFGALSQLSKANQATTDRMADLAGKLVSGGRLVAAPVLARDAIGERIAQVQQFAGDPLHATDALAHATSDVQEHAPNVAQAMQVTAARAAAFLASKVPAQPITGPMGPKLKLSQQAQWQFARYDAAVQRPTRILELAHAGQLTPMDVEAVRTVYPQLFEKMQQAALMKVTEHQGAVPYKSRLMLAMLLGRDVDGTMTREALQQNQAAYARPSQKSPMDQTGPAATGKPTQSGMAKLKGANRAALPGERLEMRGGGP